MQKILSRNKVLIYLVAIFVVICLTMGFISIGNEAFAAKEVSWDDEVIIAHITDTHYYPIRFADNKNSGEFFDYIHEQFHKMWFEAEAAFWASMDRIKNMDPLPDYLFVTGDNAQDGERHAHMDIANGLRALQEEIRETKPDFQVFVTFGNHDLYNPKVYDFSSGTKQETDAVSRKDVSIIYAGLGYPNITEEQGREYYEEYYEEYYGDRFQEYYEEFKNTRTPLQYIPSKLHEDINVAYQYDNNKEDYEVGELTYIAKTSKGHVIISLDVVESNEDEGHVLGGVITKDTQRFLNENKQDSEFCFGLAHHSIVPHFTLQKEIFTGFIINDWENGADFLADYGVRYVFTGHVHANDIAHHISFNNNQITDIETAANIGVASNVRYATIKSGSLGETRVQDLYVQNDYMKEVDMSYAIDNGYLKEDFVTYNDLDNYVDWDAKIITDYIEYAQKRMYKNTITNVVNSYVNPSGIDKVKDMILNVIPDKISGISTKPAKRELIELIDALLDEINKKILADYEYTGEKALFKDEDYKIYGFAEELVYRVLDIEVAPDLRVFDFILTFYLNHVKGNEPHSIEELPIEFQQGLEFVRSGDFIRELFDVILDKEKGLYFLIDGLANSTLELPESNTISLILTLSGLTDLSLSNLVMPEAIPMILNSSLIKELGFDLNLEDKNIMELADEAIEAYFTDALYTGLGEIVEGILLSLGTDPVFDGDEYKTRILLNEDDEFTYTSKAREDIPTIQNGKLPSKITVTFGEDSSTDKNFTWFTDKRISDSVVQYMEGKDTHKFDISKAQEKSGSTEIYGHTVALIDLGVFAQLGYAEASRHTIELKGLKPDTEYIYRVGSKEFGYFSEVFTFKTAPAKDDVPFEVLLITDPQGFTNSTYEGVKEVIEKAKSVFSNGYDFVINTGDLVDNSRNVTQYDYYLNTLREHWGNTTQVIATGNHEKYNFEKKDNYNISSDDVVVDEYNYMLMHFNFSLPEQDTRTGAYYSFDYSGVHFATLNTNDIDDNNKLSEEQVSWLKEDLKNTKKKHKIVLMHKSLYSAGSHSYDTEIINMRKQLGPIFEEYGVHLVLSGHDHTYNETYYLDSEGKIKQMANNRSQKISNKGTLFVNLGCVGNKFYDYVANDAVPVFTGEDLHNPTLSRPTFGKLVYDGKNLYYQGYEYDFETEKVIAIKPPIKFTTVELTLIIVASVVGAGIIAVGVFFLLKMRKTKIATATKAEQQEKPDSADIVVDAEVATEALASKDEKKEE